MKILVFWIFIGVIGLYTIEACAQGFSSGFAQGPGNPVNTFQINSGGINWTGANMIAAGVNWESLRTSFGNTSTSTNWQAFGV